MARGSIHGSPSFPAAAIHPNGYVVCVHVRADRLDLIPVVARGLNGVHRVRVGPWVAGAAARASSSRRTHRASNGLAGRRSRRRRMCRPGSGRNYRVRTRSVRPRVVSSPGSSKGSPKARPLGMGDGAAGSDVNGVVPCAAAARGENQAHGRRRTQASNGPAHRQLLVTGCAGMTFESAPCHAACRGRSKAAHADSLPATPASWHAGSHEGDV